jgi:hypothetical protein
MSCTEIEFKITKSEAVNIRIFSVNLSAQYPFLQEIYKAKIKQNHLYICCNLQASALKVYFAKAVPVSSTKTSDKNFGLTSCAILRLSVEIQPEASQKNPFNGRTRVPI